MFRKNSFDIDTPRKKRFVIIGISVFVCILIYFIIKNRSPDSNTTLYSPSMAPAQLQS